MDPFSQSPARRLRSAYLRMHRVTNRILRPLGVTADQYVVLRLLCEGDGIPQRELAESCASDPTTLGRMLELLEEHGFVRRKPLDTDRRARLVFLTAAGRRKVKRCYETLIPVRDTIDAAIGDDLTATEAALDRLNETFRAYEGRLNDAPDGT